MKRLFHLSTVQRQLSWFDNNWQEIEAFVEKNNIEGIELGLTMDYDISQIPAGLIEGVHLSFYPMWLEFWHRDKEKLLQLLGNEAGIEAYYGGAEPESMVENYKRQYARAKALGAKYMVFHVSHVLPEDSFTWEFEYTDEEILKATIELVNAVFEADEDGPLLLFENLWWPGLTYLNPELTKWFIEQIQYKNKGYLVDVSHLILTNPEIGRETEAYEYIKTVMTNLGETAKWIKGMHLNKTLPKHYRQRDHQYLLERYRSTKDKGQKLSVLKNHIHKLDGHQPFDHEAALDIVQLIQPEFCVYETAPSSRYELAYFIKKQNQALGITK